ncbi:MAG: hypothetical protein ACPMAQ_09575 [Phycisphaerae bacterium]
MFLEKPPMPRVDLETSYVSACVTDRTDTDSLCRLKHSREWWDGQRQWHELYVSPEVLAELSVGSYRCKNEALAWIRGVPVLEINDDVLGLARVLIHEKAMPAGSGDPLIDEVRAIKYELSARFDHDLEKLAAHLKAVQEDIARREPQRIVRPARRP